MIPRPSSSRAADRGLGQSAVDAALWTVSQRWVVRITGFVTVAVLTRMLTPADFGAVAIGMSLLPLMYVLADLGFSTYIVQAREADPRMLSTAFWFSSGAGVLLAGAFIACAPLLDELFDADWATEVMWGLAPAILLVTATTVPTSLLRRRMAFKALALQSLCASVIAQAVAIVAALAGAGVWALILQVLVNQLVSSAFAWFAAGWRPGFMFDRAEFTAMMSFGSKVVGVELVATCRLLAENAIIAAALGVTGLGYVNIAQRLVQVAQDVTAAVILPISTVVFAQVRESASRIRSYYLRSLGLTYAVIIPVMVLLAVTTPLLIPAVFGDQWFASIAPAQVLAVVSVFVMGAMLDHGLFYGAGKPGRWFVYAVVVDAATVVTALFTAPHGLVAWAFGFLGVAIAATVARWPLVAALLHTRWTRIARVFARAMGAGAITGVSAAAVALAVSSMAPAAQIAILVIAVLVAHLAAMGIFMPGELRDGMRLTVSRLRRPFRTGHRATPAKEEVQ